MTRDCSSFTLRKGFRKPTYSSLTLRKAFFESLRLPFQRELHLFPQAPSSSEGGGCNRSSSELSFRKPTSPPLTLREGPPLISVFSPQGRRGNRPTRCSNRYAIRLADHQRSAPVFLCGMNRMGEFAADKLLKTALYLPSEVFAKGWARLHWEGVASCPPIKKCPNL